MSHKHFTHEVFLTHVVSMDLLDYLCPVHKKEVLKVDAFRDLLNKTCQQPTGAMKKEGTPLVIEAGQLVTSVSELARVWDWHRDKVRDFINALAERDILTIDMHKKFMVLSFPDLAGRIAAFVAKGGNGASANSVSSHDGASEDNDQQIVPPSVIEKQDAAAKVAQTQATVSITHSGSEKKAGSKVPIVNGSHYHEARMFSDEEMAGSQNVPDSTHFNDNI